MRNIGKRAARSLLRDDTDTMFSIMTLSSTAAHLLEQLGARVSRAKDLPKEQALSLAWPAFDAALPDGGFPRGVVELSAPHSLGGATMVALAAVRAAQSKDSRVWCAWVDPGATLYAPGVVMAGVELHRLFIVRPRQADVGRVVVKVARSLAFAVIVVDADPGRGGSEHHGGVPQARRDRSREVLVRKLALLAADGGSTILLLTDSLAPHPAPLPVALRLELERAPEAIRVRIGKDRYGRGGLAQTVPLQDRPRLHLAG
jgi:hypothetical protein